MIDSVIVLEPQGWFDNQLRRRSVQWRDGLTVGDLFPGSPVDRMAFKIGSRMARRNDQVGPGDVVVGVESPAGEAVVGFIIQVLISAAVGFVVSKLIGPPKAPKAIGDESKPSESFSFGGTRTIYSGNGVPLPLVYGERAVGGVVIGSNVFASGSPQPQQVLTILLALCSGPVESVAGFTTDRDGVTGAEIPDDLLINENPASSYSGIEISVRLGSVNQTAIAGAPTATLEALIGLPITNEHIDDALPAVTDWSNAVVHTMAEDGDGFLLSIAFLNGLYSSGGASILPEEVSFEVRYRRVDDFGVPFGDYWPGGTVAPTLGIPFSVERALLAPFSEGIFFQLFDPAQAATIIASEAIHLHNDGGGSGVYLDSDGTATDGSGGGAWPDDGSTVEAYSVEMFVRLGNTISIFNTGLVMITDEFPEVGNSAVPHDPDGTGTISAFKGLCLYARPSGSNTRFVGFVWGDGVGVGEDVGWTRCESGLEIDNFVGGSGIDTEAISAPVSPDMIAHIVCTFERNFDGNGNNRGRLYLNGALQATKVSTIDFNWPATADLYEFPVSKVRGPVLINHVQGAQFLDSVIHVGHNVIDRVVLYREALSENDAFFKYANGNGEIPNLQTEQVEAWWEMGSVDLVDAGSEFVMLDRSGNSHTLRVYQGAHGGAGQPQKPTYGVASAFVIQPGFGLGATFIGSQLRGRYEISIQRVDLVEDSNDLSDKATLESLTIFTSTRFSYPEIALISIRVPAQDQLSGLQPNVSCPVRGFRVPIWDGLSESNPTYTYQWSRNNAWIGLHMLTAKHTGLDRFHSLTDSPIIAKWKAWADFCDELVDDQVAPFDPTTEVGATTTMTALVTVSGNTIRFETGSAALSPHLIPSNWSVGDTLIVNSMPAGQVSDGWPDESYYLVVTALGNNTPQNYVECAWPSGLSYPPTGSATIALNASTITFSRLEPRSEADVVVDSENQSAWELLLEVCNAGRAVPVRIGDQVGIAFQGLRSPVQMFSDANVIPGSVTLSSHSSEEEFNSVDYRFHNRLKQYRRDAKRVDHSDLSDGSNTQIASRSLSTSIITRASQIARESRYLLNLNKLIGDWIEFETAVEALAIEPGDVFLFSGSDPAFGFAGRLPAQLNIGATSLAVDVDVNFDAGVTYRLAVTTQDGTIEQTVVTASAGFYAAGASISISPALAGTALRDAHWAFGTLDTVTREYQLTVLEITDTLTVIVRGAEYNADVHDETSFPDLPTESGSELYDPSGGNGFPPPLAALSVEEVAGPSPFGTVGSTGLFVSIQHSTTSALLGSRNQAGNANDVVVTARPVSSVAKPVTLGVIAAGSTFGLFELQGGQWAPGTLIEVSAAPSSPAGAASSPTRARKARVRLSGRGPMPTAPRGLVATQTGSSVIYRVLSPVAGSRARPIRAEIRAGGWILGQHVATVVPGEPTRPSDAWLVLPEGAMGRKAAPLYTRFEFANGQWSDAYILTGFEPSAPGAELKSDSYEEGPWDSVTGDSGSVALSEMESESQPDGDEVLRFTDASASLTGTWTSPEYDVGAAQKCAVFFAIEGSQIHPMTFEGAVGNSRAYRDWSIEGPLSDFPDMPASFQGQCEVTLEIAYSDTATPGTDWQEYRPGVFSARSFAFRISVTRPSVEFNVSIWRGAFAITEPASVVSHAGSF